MTKATEDFLDVDTPIPGQNYACVSFISPDNIIRKKEMFSLRKFLRYEIDNILKENNGAENVKNLLDSTDKDTNLEAKYEYFLNSHGEDIEKEFSEENKNVTSVRGIKVRGVYDTLREAEVRSKVLQRKDPNFNIYVAQVGYWVPWDPSYDEAQVIEKQEHMNDQLNELMKKHKENTEMRNVVFEERMSQVRKEVEEQNASKIEEINESSSEVKEQMESSVKEVKNIDSNINDEDVWMKRKQEEKSNVEVI